VYLGEGNVYTPNATPVLRLSANSHYASELRLTT
jgi:hypothetical protein